MAPGFLRIPGWGRVWLGEATVSFQVSPSFNKKWAGAAATPVLGVSALPPPCDPLGVLAPRACPAPWPAGFPKNGAWLCSAFLPFTGDRETCGQSIL